MVTPQVEGLKRAEDDMWSAISAIGIHLEGTGDTHYKLELMQIRAELVALRDSLVTLRIRRIEGR